MTADNTTPNQPRGIGFFQHEPPTLFPPRLLPLGQVERFVALAERDGLVVPEPDGYASGDGEGHFGTLDLWAGDLIVADRWVPTEAAWQALNSELQLVEVQR